MLVTAVVFPWDFGSRPSHLERPIRRPDTKRTGVGCVPRVNPDKVLPGASPGHSVTRLVQEFMDRQVNALLLFA